MNRNNYKGQRKETLQESYLDDGEQSCHVLHRARVMLNKATGPLHSPQGSHRARRELVSLRGCSELGPGCPMCRDKSPAFPSLSIPVPWLGKQMVIAPCSFTTACSQQEQICHGTDRHQGTDCPQRKREQGEAVSWRSDQIPPQPPVLPSCTLSPNGSSCL